jgi:hypothetical protein
VAAGALVAAPSAYQRLRTLVQPPSRPALPPPRHEQPMPPREPAPAAAFAAYDAPPAEDDETTELRMRIDETRDRIRRRATLGEPEGGAPPEDDAPPEAG